MEIRDSLSAVSKAVDVHFSRLSARERDYYFNEFDDIITECSMRHYKSYDESRGANPETYASVIVGNAIKDVRKTRAYKDSMRNTNLPICDDISTWDTEGNSTHRNCMQLQDSLASDEFSMFELISAITSAIKSETDERIVNLRLMGYSNAEIGAVVGISNVAVGKRLKRIQKDISLLGII